MRNTSIRMLTDEERNILYDMMVDDDKEDGYRAKIIMLKDKGYISRNKTSN
jgi:hypothetical protein